LWHKIFRDLIHHDTPRDKNTWIDFWDLIHHDTPRDKSTWIDKMFAKISTNNYKVVPTFWYIQACAEIKNLREMVAKIIE
jgi:hypothetical protein